MCGQRRVYPTRNAYSGYPCSNPLRGIGALMWISSQRAGQLAKAAILTLDLAELEAAVLRGATDR